MPHKWLIALALAALGPPSVAREPVPAPIYGWTLDSVDSLPKIVDSAKSLAKKTTVRVVLDPETTPEDYAEAVRELSKHAYVMAELLDSMGMSQISEAEFRERAETFISALSPHVDIWEMGNEINGEWLGTAPGVLAKLEAGNAVARAKNVTQALTLYYNEECWADSENEMFTWVENHLGHSLRETYDYIFISYYEDDCNGLQPDWEKVFARLGMLFPTARLGFGEVGTRIKNRKQAYLKRYYTLRLSHPRFVGGYFWWYGREDFVPKTSPYWKTFNTLLKGARHLLGP